MLYPGQTPVGRRQTAFCRRVGQYRPLQRLQAVSHLAAFVILVILLPDGVLGEQPSLLSLLLLTFPLLSVADTKTGNGSLRKPGVHEVGRGEQHSLLL